MATDSAARNIVVGVTARRGDPAWVRDNTRHYLNVLAAHGVYAVVLAPDAPAALPDGSRFSPDEQGRLPADVIERLDGLLLAGGGDVDPKYFGAVLAGAEADSIDLKRDELELSLSRQALAADLPVLGICRGCQVLNVAAGGGLVQHLDGHRSPKDSAAYHDVAIVADTKLHDIVGSQRLKVNTYHHQGVDTATIAPMFRASGIADPDTWLVEAYESSQHRWVVGVQWHPERLFELSDGHLKLWDSFIAACRLHSR